MARKARLKSCINIYHVIIRGADRQRIFECHSDYSKYLEILERYKNELDFEIYAYCLMSNHVHLLINTKQNTLENIFRHINTYYAVWFNMKYQRTGFLQQGRYHSEPIESADYFLTAMRYIHQNPTRAGLESYPGESYSYSSLNDYLSNNSKLINPSFLTNVFGDTENFLNFNKVSSDKECLDIHKVKTRIPDDVAREIIINECNCSTACDFQKLSLEDRNKNLISLHKKGISIRQLNRLTGIPKGVIDRTVTKGHSS